MATNDTILIDGILDNIISSYNMENTQKIAVKLLRILLYLNF